MSNDDRQNEDVENSAKFESDWFRMCISVKHECIYIYLCNMYVCMSIRMYIYINIYIYVCMYVYIHVLFIWIHTGMCIYMYIYVCIYVHIYIYIYIHIRSPHMLGTQHALILLDSRVVILKSSGIWPLCPAIRDLLGVIEETLASQRVGDLR